MTFTCSNVLSLSLQLERLSIATAVIDTLSLILITNGGDRWRKEMKSISNYTYQTFVASDNRTSEMNDMKFSLYIGQSGFFERGLLYVHILL